MSLPSNLFFVIFWIGLAQVVSANICIDSKANSCGKCIAVPGCAWCEDPGYANNPNEVISRCNVLEELVASGCSNSSISNPKSQQRPTMDKGFSGASEVSVGSATQIKPQGIEVKLRPGDPETINFAFKLVEDYPVDLYYLLDLSSSMKDDLDSLRSLGKDLGESMQKITKDLRMGFGSFVDKTVMPFISTVPQKIEKPCSTCDPAYSFHNDLPLTADIDAFVDAVKRVNVSSNIDHPEGGMDAIMQVVVCQQAIGWRTNATHLLIFSTDANFHIAGDGRLGGIVIPNDGRCHLDFRGEYTEANAMDYPSIGHVVQKINENKIQPIFAVTSNVVTTYENLHDVIPKSVVGKLTDSSKNIISLVENAYNDLKGKIIIDVKTPKGISISDKQAICVSKSSDQLQCDGVKLRDTVHFQFSISAEHCLPKPASVLVSVYGYNDVLNITVLPKCDCECESVKPSQMSSNCSGHGEYKCGACVCELGFTGLDCSCDQAKANEEEGIEAYIKNCSDPATNLVCSDRGTCQCGRCLCNQRPEQKIYGTYCHCDNTTCDRVEGRVCNNAGKCDCGVCECNAGWSGQSCECSLDTTPCIDTSADALDSSTICNGNGKCVCGECVCGQAPKGGTYRGSFCKTPPIVVCEQHKDCIQCLAFGTGKYVNQTTCQENCHKYNVTKKKDAQGNKCIFIDSSDDCEIIAFFEEDSDVIMVEVEPDKVCKAYLNPTYVILGIIAAIVLIGLAILCIWKLLTSIKDAREFKNFQKESLNAKWQAGENPIYKKATSTFRNPTYTGGKPTTNL